MKKFRDRCGAALLEVLISIAMLGLLVVPISSSILMPFHINERSRELLQARLAVSSAVERILAEGVENCPASEFPGLSIEKDAHVDTYGNVTHWSVEVSSAAFEDVKVSVVVRAEGVRAS